MIWFSNQSSLQVRRHEISLGIPERGVIAITWGLEDDFEI
jgi:hypothetical protein